MRVKDLTQAEMSPEQLSVANDASAGKRGRVPAPMRAWIHSPELAARSQRLGEFVRYDTCLEPANSELAILVTARHWSSQYEWFVHKSEALKAGLDPTIIDAIALRHTPSLSDAKEKAIYDYTLELHQKHTVSVGTHSAAVEALTAVGVVELVGIIGYYTYVAMTLNAFDIGVPDGESQDLDD